MRKLDRERPFGTTYGKHKSRYTQDGREFDANGRMLGEEPEPQSTESPGVALDKQTTVDLKRMVNEAGGEYKNRIDAITFLANR